MKTNKIKKSTNTNESILSKACVAKLTSDELKNKLYSIYKNSTTVRSIITSAYEYYNKDGLAITYDNNDSKFIVMVSNSKYVSIIEDYIDNSSNANMYRFMKELERKYYLEKVNKTKNNIITLITTLTIIIICVFSLLMRLNDMYYCSIFIMIWAVILVLFYIVFLEKISRESKRYKK